MRIALFVAATAVTLAACSDEKPQAPAGTEIAENGAATVPPPRPAPAELPKATGPGTAFGLTKAQLEDADLVDATGADLGDVERIEADGAGNVTGVIAKVDGSSPARLVRLPIASLSAVASEEDWDLRTKASKAQLETMPAVER